MAEMHDVSFRFSSVVTGISSLEEMSPPVNTFEVYEVVGREAISDLYSFEIQLFSQDPYIDGSKLINQRATLEADMNGDIATYQGIIASFDEESRGHYRALLVPQLWLASLTKQSQIFLDKDLKTIVTDVLKENGLKEGDDFSIVLKGKHRVRDYTVQYEESDLSFVRRLLEHEGAYFWFEHGEEKEKLIIRDLKGQHAPFQEAPEDQVALRGPGFVAGEEIVGSIRVQHRVLPQKVILKDYNYRKPTVEMKATADAMKKGTGFVMEYGNHFKTPEEGTELATIRAQEITCRETRYIGSSGCRRFHPGFLFTLIDDLKIWREEKVELLLVAVEHIGKQDWVSVEGAAPARGRTTYHNTFEAIKSDVQFRPERKTPRPRLSGVMHANIDAGGSGQYAEIDDQGRYKVKLPFDLSDAAAGKASHSIRMAQPYAGANYGTHFPLHKGIEVLLTHVDGDLDRPVIDGAVPNPVTGSAVTGANHSQSVCRTAGGNEMVLEDLAGSERCHFSTPFADSYLDMGSNHAAGKDVPPGITLGTKEGISINAGKGISIIAGSGSGVHKDGLSKGTQAIDTVVGGIAAAAAVCAVGSALAAEKIAAGHVAKAAAAADILGCAGGLAFPSVYIAAPGKVFCGAVSEVILTAGLTLDMAAIGPANIMSVAGVLVAGLGSASVVSGGTVECVSVKSDVKLHAKLKNVDIKALRGIVAAAKTKSISAVAKETIAFKAQTKDFIVKAKKNIDLTAEEEDYKVKAKKSVNLVAETNNVVAQAKHAVEFIAEESDVTLNALATDVEVLAKKYFKATAEEENIELKAQKKILLTATAELIELKCGDSSLTLNKDGKIVLKGKDIDIDGGSGPIKIHGGKIDLN